MINLFIICLQVHYKPAPYSSDEAAKLERANCDYSIKITKEMADCGTGIGIFFPLLS